MSLKFQSKPSGFTSMVITVDSLQDLQHLFNVAQEAYDNAESGSDTEGCAHHIREAIIEHAKKCEVHLEME